MEFTQSKSAPLEQIQASFPIGKRTWAARPLSSLLLGVAIMMGGPALAHDDHQQDTATVSDVSSLRVQESSYPNLPFVDLGVVDSKEGETKNEYMLRVGVVLDQFTHASGHEACGVVMENRQGDAWRVRLITNRSQVACVKMLFDEPGYLFTDETIHSHPQPRYGRVYANSQDQRLRGFQCGRGLLINDEDFSPGDIENGPGYLVARGKLLYHRDGIKTHVGDIPPATVIEGLAQIPNETGRMSAPQNQRTMFSSMVQAAYITAWGKTDEEGLPAISCKSARSMGR